MCLSSHVRGLWVIISLLACSVVGQAQVPPPILTPENVSTSSTAAFEVVSIRAHPAGYWPTFAKDDFTSRRFTAINIQVQRLIAIAYGLQDPELQFQGNLIAGAPRWLLTDWYDIQAIVPESLSAELSSSSPQARDRIQRQLLQRLLAERFNLKVQSNLKKSPAYQLVLFRNGPKHLEPVGEETPESITWKGWSHGEYRGAPMSRLVALLTSLEHAPVIDGTKLTGKYDFTLEWARDPDTMPPNSELPQESELRLPITMALQQELGLALVKTDTLLPSLVIEHIDRPSEN